MSEGRETDNAEEHRKPDRQLAGRPMTMRLADVNGINIAYRVQGEGPPLDPTISLAHNYGYHFVAAGLDQAVLETDDFRLRTRSPVVGRQYVRGWTFCSRLENRPLALLVEVLEELLSVVREITERYK